MIKKQSRTKIREQKHRRLRSKIHGTATRPRLAVYRSGQHIYAQIIDDTKAVTIASASTVAKDMKIENGGNIEAATAVGTAVAKKAIANGIEEVVFDRGGYLYHGRVKALADAAREAGLKF